LINLRLKNSDIVKKRARFYIELLSLTQLTAISQTQKDTIT